MAGLGGSENAKEIKKSSKIEQNTTHTHIVSGWKLSSNQVEQGSWRSSIWDVCDVARTWWEGTPILLDDC